MTKHAPWFPFVAGLALLGLVSCEAHRREAPVSRNPVVEVRKTSGGAALFRNGQPYKVKGVAGWTNIEQACEAGANSIRTYTTENLDSLLDLAHSLDMTVMAGIYMGRAIEGFDFGDQMAVEEQKKRVLHIVETYKDHPALLCWAVGNEVDNGLKTSKKLWPALNDLILLIKKTDPNHPVTTVVEPASAKDVISKCSGLDFISINTFANIPNFIKSYDEEIPYLITELGVKGPWEADKTPWKAPIEPACQKKMEMLSNYYRLLENDSTRCLGIYVFFWGHKQEMTHTWFNFFLEGGQKTPMTDLMHHLWSGHPPRNYAPIAGDIEIEETPGESFTRLEAGQTYTFCVPTFDREGDSLQFHWEILPEGPFHAYIEGRGKVEIKAPPLEDIITAHMGDRIEVRIPDRTGPFRVFVQIADGQGNGASANMPVFFVNHSLTGD